MLAASGPLPTTNRTVPATGCESAEITRQLSTYVPSPSPGRRFTAIFVPSPPGCVGVPASTRSPDGSMTWK